MPFHKVSLEAVENAANHVYPYFLLDEKTKQQIQSMDFTEVGDGVAATLDFITELLNEETFTIAILASLGDSLNLSADYQGLELLDLKDEVKFDEILQGISLILFYKLQQYQQFALEHSSGRLFPDE
jgi:hypothetical protein